MFRFRNHSASNKVDGRKDKEVSKMQRTWCYHNNILNAVIITFKKLFNKGIIMLLEIAGFIGIFVLILFTYGEHFRKKEVCLMASLLLLVLGFWILFTGIQIQTGTATTILTGTICRGVLT